MRKYARLKEPLKQADGSCVYKIMLYEAEEGICLFEYSDPAAVLSSADLCYDSAEDLYEEWNDRIDAAGWIETEDPLPYCQQDAFIPLRVKGRDAGKPEWGRYETLKDGEWIDQDILSLCIIRSLRKNETELLKDFLYEAIFIPEGVKAPDKDIVERPELRVYTDDFGSRRGDHCLAAELGGRIVGAVWTRIMDDYGHVDDDTPSFAISLYKEYRGQGIGSRLMAKMLELLKRHGYRKASLAVQKANYAVSMYEKAGFRTVSENEEEYIMVCEL